MFNKEEVKELWLSEEKPYGGFYGLNNPIIAHFYLTYKEYESNGKKFPNMIRFNFQKINNDYIFYNYEVNQKGGEALTESELLEAAEFIKKMARIKLMFRTEEEKKWSYYLIKEK